MSLYKRKPGKNQNWWVRFRLGKREIRQSTGTTDRELAEEFEHRLREQAYKVVKLGVGPINVWDDATALWFNDRRTKRDIKGDEQKCTWFDKYLKGEPLESIDKNLVAKIRAVLSAEKKAVGTVNKYLAFLRAVLNHAHQAGLCNAPPKIAAIKGPQYEPRTFTDEEIEKLLSELISHARAMVEFALETGLRSGNILKLQWQNVDLPGKHLNIKASSSKSAKPIGIPLSGRAVEILEAQQGKHEEYVFTDQRGRAPLGSIKTAWLRALSRAGLSGLRFHDLRHTWASRAVARGVPLGVVKDLGGWQSLAMVERYSHLRRDDLAQWVD